MNRRELFYFAAGAALAPLPSFAGTVAVPPQPARRPVRIEQLGRVRIDEYAWMRDPDWKGVSLDPSLLQPEIRQHLLAENCYAEAILGQARSRQEKYVERMSALTASDDVPLAAPDGPWEYYRYFRAGEDHPVHARRRRRGGGKEQILLDEQARAKGYAYYRITETAHSPDHSLFLWLEATEGGDRYRICVHDLRTGEIQAAPAADAFAIESAVFTACSQWLFWIRRDQHGRPTTVLRRPSRGGADVVVYEEKDPALFIVLGRTASHRYVTIRIHGPDLDEIRLITADDPTGVPRLIEPRQAGLHYQVEDWNGELVILTDADGALDGKLMRTSLAALGREYWRPWIAHREGCQILQMRAFEKHFVRLQRRDGRLEIVVSSSAASSAETPLAFNEEAYTVGLDHDQEYASSVLRLVYESPRTPPQSIDCDLASGQRKVVKAQSAGGGYSAGDHQVRRLFAHAPDGESVPITVLMHKRTRLDGSAPLLLYAYGSYGVSTEAEFSVANLALVEQGWIYAIAHVRGGSEKGRRWFLDGRRLKKANTFTDFIACAEHLIAQRYTRRRRIVAYGLSAGGLLMGAIANMRPDLWAGVIAQVPFVDMLNTMSDAEHPLVPLFRPDWGDPLADPQAYDYIASISPYENVKPQRYPAILATAGLRDDRVSYWEAAKWVANLRRQTTGKAPILFLTDMTAGHQAAAGRSSQYRQIALFWAFAEQSLTFAGK